MTKYPERKESTLIQVIPAYARHFTGFDWIKAYWLFSFSEYYDPANIQLGALRAFNDDASLHTPALARIPTRTWISLPSPPFLRSTRCLS